MFEEKRQQSGITTWGLPAPLLFYAREDILIFLSESLVAK